jgi:ribose 5-phosphate isomerase A
LIDPTERLKREAAARALERVDSGLTLGLGTGSTMAHFLELLGAALAAGTLSGISGVPTSERTARLSRELRIPLTTLADSPRLDLAVDGADEIDPGLEAIKGLGGALLREKMVAQAADRLCLIVDEGKLVGRLGEKSPVPIEVVRFGWESHLHILEESGAEPVLRVSDDREPYVTDNGNYIIDAHFPEGIPDADALEALLRARAGVVESGLFLGMATSVVVASPDGTRVMERG